MKSSRLSLAVIAGGLLLAGGSRVSGGYHLAPGALSALSSGDLIILDSHLGLFRYKPGVGKVVPLVDGFGLYEGIDMQVATVGGVESIFVSQVPRSGSLGARLVRFNLDGKEKGEWVFPPWKGRCSGVAVDAQALVAYLVSVQGEIFKLDLRKSKRPPEPLARISQATALGAVILDGKRRRLLVADAAVSALYAADMDNGSTARLAKNIGEISALAILGGKDQLILADISGRRLLVMDLAGKEQKPRLFVKLKEFEEPMGLVPMGDGTLWVGDGRAGRLFQISGDGKLVTTVRL
jgi:hypothetical protein